MLERSLPPAEHLGGSSSRVLALAPYYDASEKSFNDMDSLHVSHTSQDDISTASFGGSYTDRFTNQSQLSRSSPAFSRTPQEIIDEIVDRMAETDDGDESRYDRQRIGDFASCSLVCRAFVPRSSHYLFRNVFMPPFSRRKINGEDVVCGDWETLIMEVSSSVRLRQNVIGITLHWMDGMPSPHDCVTAIINLPLHILSVLRCSELPLANLSPVTRLVPSRPFRYLKTLELGYSRFRTKQRGVLYKTNYLACLGSFCRIDNLFLRGTGSFVYPSEISRTGDSKLEVHTLHLSFSSPIILDHLSPIFSPTSLKKMVVRGYGQAVIPIGTTRAFNSFLNAHGQELEMISLAIPFGNGGGDGMSEPVSLRLLYLSRHIIRTYLTLELSCKLCKITGGGAPSSVIQRTSSFECEICISLTLYCHIVRFLEIRGHYIPLLATSYSTTTNRV